MTRARSTGRGKKSAGSGAPGSRRTREAGGRTNRRAPRRQRQVKARARFAAWAAAAGESRPPRKREPLTIPLSWVKIALGVLLLPACLVTTLAFFDTFTTTAIDHGLWRSQEFWFFALGVLLWLIWFWGLPRPMTLYVLGHELTHACFILLCGGRIEEFRIGPGGGHVVTNRNNVLISLSPYFVPFYSILVIGAFAVAGQFTDLTRVHPGAIYGIADFRWSWALFGLIGLTWGFHLTFTVWMIGKDQPDLRENGVFFSLVLIFLANLLAIAGGLVLVSPDTTLEAFAFRWWSEAAALWGWTGQAAASVL